jgi:SAM-dependent methyltransferase
VADPSAPARLASLLRCPACDSAPELDPPRCPGCGRPAGARGGGLDLLADRRRAEADDFARQYVALRAREGWASPERGERPDGTRRWRERRAAIAMAATLVRRGLDGGGRAVVGDIGAGGGWAADLLPGADVIAFDLLDVAGEVGGGGPALRVRGDMRRLPLGAGTVDALLYSAALHHAPVRDAAREAARVLRAGGLLVSVESPIYPDPRARDDAARRSASYYAGAGFPDLAAHYFPIEIGELRDALHGAGFRVERLDPPRRRYGPLAPLLGRRRFPALVARLTT